MKQISELNILIDCCIIALLSLIQKKRNSFKLKDINEKKTILLFSSLVSTLNDDYRMKSCAF